MKLCKREKITILVLVLTALYGLYSLIFAPTSASGPHDRHPEIKALKTFAQNLSKDIEGTTDKSAALYVIEKAAAKWPEIPFMRNSLPTDEVQVSEKPPAPLADASRWHFSGFLETAAQRLAVINGVEYQEGEWLEDGGHKVAQILQSHVVIESLETQARTVVPLEESMEFFDSEENPRSGKARRANAGHES